MSGIESMNFQDLSWNCKRIAKVNGKCLFKGNCRTLMVVYKNTCNITKNNYIWNIKQNLKQRIDTHCSEVCALVNRDMTSDNFARRFASNFSVEEKIKRKKVREKL